MTDVLVTSASFRGKSLFCFFCGFFSSEWPEISSRLSLCLPYLKKKVSSGKGKKYLSFMWENITFTVALRKIFLEMPLIGPLTLQKNNLKNIIQFSFFPFRWFQDGNNSQSIFCSAKKKKKLMQLNSIHSTM